MIRAGLRLLALYFAAWLLSVHWDTANLLYRSAVSTGSAWLPAHGPAWTLLALCGASLLWNALTLGLWVQFVKVDGRLGPTKHPYPRRPLRLDLRFTASRFLALFCLNMLGLLLGLRSLVALVPAQTPAALPWPAAHGDLAVWATYAALHLGAAALARGLFAGYGRLLANTTSRAYGFVRYHEHQRPLLRTLTRILLFAHLPLAAFAATSHPHPFHLVYCAVSILVLVMTALVGQALTYGFERRHDRWLLELEAKAAAPVLSPYSPAYDIWARTLRFLHPELGELPRPQRNGTAPTPPEPAPSALATVTAAASDSPEASGKPDEPTEKPGADTVPAPREVAAPKQPQPSVSAPKTGRAALEAGIARLEESDYRRARALLKDAVASGDDATRERAESLLKNIPGSRSRAVLAILLLATPVLALVTLVALEWVKLPDGHETLSLARSAHIHVRKTSSPASLRIDLLGMRYDYSLNTALENISPHFVNAVVASEDHRYFEHGVSYKVAKFVQAGTLCVLRKLNPFAQTRACRGNSTLPQQLARNLLLSETRSIRRKLTELLWAIKMETSLSKEQILELYMNRIYLGNGNFGVEMAARAYFRKSAAQLTVAEAAYLAAAIKRPNWNWHQDRAGALARSQLIVTLMKNHGLVAAHERIDRNFRPKLGYRTLYRPYLGHLWQWVRPTVTETMRDLPDGDYKVLTSLNAEVEVYAERHLEDAVRELRAKGVDASQGAVVVMRRTGEVLAMVGGVGDDVTARGFNRAKRTRGMLARPPASSFKPFVYLAALEHGLTPDSLIEAGPVDIEIPGAPNYRPLNYDGKVYGRVTMREGLTRSINTAAVHLLHGQLGFGRLFDTLTRLGLDPSHFKRQWGVALGQSPVTLVDMVGAYGVIAAQGRAVTPHAVLAITTEHGRIVWRRPEATAKNRFRSRHIASLHDMLREVVRRGTGRRATYKVPADLTVAGKTGTGDDFVDAWFLGYAEDIVIGVWIGNDQPRRMPGVYGGTAPARVFNEVLRDLIDHTDVIAAEED